MNMNGDSQGGCGRWDRLAILEITGEETKDNQIYILVVLGAGIGPTMQALMTWRGLPQRGFVLQFDNCRAILV
jgi:hypothetical protein